MHTGVVKPGKNGGKWGKKSWVRIYARKLLHTYHGRVKQQQSAIFRVMESDKDAADGTGATQRCSDTRHNKQLVICDKIGAFDEDLLLLQMMQ